MRALVQRLGPHAEEVEPVVVKPGDQVDRDDLVARLVAGGYRREYQVEARGEVAVRGSIVDVYPSTDDHPVRIDLWGDEVDRLSAFSVADQRSTHDVAEACIFPTRELLPTDDVRARATALVAQQPWGREQWERLAEGQLFDGMESWLPWLTDREHLLTDLLPNDALVLLVEPKRMRDRAQELLDEEASLASTLAVTWGAGGERDLPRLSLEFDRLLAHTGAGAVSMLSTPDGPDTPRVAASAFDPVVGDADALARRLRALAGEGYRVVLAAEGTGSAQRLRDILAGEGLDAGAGEPAPGAVRLLVAPLERGVVLPGAHLALVAEADLTGRRRVHRRARGARRGQDYYDDLKAGDYVVHHQHGVGKYLEMKPLTMGGVERDYLWLEFKDGKVYVPTDQVGFVRKYTGGETPSLNRMGGADFEKQRARVRSAVREIAEELVVLYRQRLATPGRAFGPDTPWQHEMEEAFPFEETPDQMQAIIDVKGDMERPIPMDRLVCGDVGYGKTEVAVRAAFKAVQEGTQVVVLVPTTLLAGQHGQTFRERFANYPVRVEVLSRFLSAKEQHAVVRDFESGAVDVLIGTHRLLSSDVHPKNLGLLVVDEEQRFGVQHKELIKQMAHSVDVLTLTATPIPRTLELSLTGIRDLSLVNTPPEDRQPILTYVGEYDDRAAAEAIRRELLREGQVFYVHNRVRDIELVAENVRALVPDARVAVAHGQMDENRLERVVLDFAEREFDVLVCTTIVESGIDMPTVNTLVVDRSDLLGLAQMYQLRGRVGRRGQRGVRVPLPPGRPGAERGGVRAAQDHRRVHRPRLGVQDRHARPRDPRRRQPAGPGAVGAHRRRRLRPLLPDGHRGGRRAQGRAGDRAGRHHHRRARRRQPAARVRAARRRAHGGVPTPRRGHRDRRRRRHPRRVGGPLRPAAGIGRRTARRRPAPGGVRAPRHPQHHRAAQHRSHRRRGPEGVAEGPPPAPRAQGGGQGRRARRAGVGGAGRGRHRAGRPAPRPPPAPRRDRCRRASRRGARASLRNAMSRFQMNRRRLAMASIAVVTVLCLVGVSILAVAAGGSALAYEVNGTRMSQDTIDSQLDDIANTKGLATQVSHTEGSIDSKVAAQILTANIVLQVVRDAAERKGVKVTAADRPRPRR